LTGSNLHLNFLTKEEDKKEEEEAGGTSSNEGSHVPTNKAGPSGKV